MNWLSLLLLAVIGFATFRAYRNGFVRELVSLSSVILAIPIAGVFYDDLYPKVHPIVDDAAAASLISFLTILVAVLMGGQVVAYLLKRSVSLLNLGLADNATGAAFGFLKGVLICQAALLAFVAFPNPDLTGDIDESRVAEGLLDTTPLVLSLLPRTFDYALDLFTAGVPPEPEEEGRPLSAGATSGRSGAAALPSSGR